MGRPNIKYSTVPGYFLQDELRTDPIGFDYVSNKYSWGFLCTDKWKTTTNFGLIDRSYEKGNTDDLGHETTQWQRFSREVNRLNSESNSKTQYKLFFMGRHGEGYVESHSQHDDKLWHSYFYSDHNVAEAYYGTKAWDVCSHFSLCHKAPIKVYWVRRATKTNKVLLVSSRRKRNQIMAWRSPDTNRRGTSSKSPRLLGTSSKRTKNPTTRNLLRLSPPSMYRDSSPDILQSSSPILTSLQANRKGALQGSDWCSHVWWKILKVCD